MSLVTVHDLHLAEPLPLPDCGHGAPVHHPAHPLAGAAGPHQALVAPLATQNQVLQYTVQYSTVQYSSIQYSTIQYLSPLAPQHEVLQLLLVLALLLVLLPRSRTAAATPHLQQRYLGSSMWTLIYYIDISAN